MLARGQMQAFGLMLPSVDEGRKGKERGREMKLTDMKIHKDAIELAVRFRAYYKTFSKDDQYSIGAQMLRSSISIASNIAEGVGRDGSDKALLQFLRYSSGSLYEFKTQLEIIQIDYDNNERKLCSDKLLEVEDGLEKFIRYIDRREHRTK